MLSFLPLLKALKLENPIVVLGDGPMNMVPRKHQA